MRFNDTCKTTNRSTTKHSSEFTRGRQYDPRIKIDHCKRKPGDGKPDESALACLIRSIIYDAQLNSNGVKSEINLIPNIAKLLHLTRLLVT